MPDFNRDAHVLDGEDQRRIDCCRCDEYATMCEHSKLYTGSVAFYYYCSTCWHTPGPNAPSPAERTGLPAPGVQDTAHGYTFSEWLAAAGRLDSTSNYDLRAAWRAGEAPEEYYL